MFMLFVSLLFMTTMPLFSSVYKKLDDRMIAANSLVCVGLDPDITKMPVSIINRQHTREEAIYNFLTKVIDITAPHVCAFKIQKAFYDQLTEGHILLKMTILYIRLHYPDIPVFIDCKIGDTDNTMKAYMQLFFKDMKADAVVVNPYMGDDVFEPFMSDPEKGAIVLVQTSNPHAKIVQEIRTDNGKKVWEEILDLTLHRWNKNNNLIIVLSSNTDGLDYTHVRNKIPQEVPILLAGIGLQGGDSTIIKKLLNNEKRGVFVNSSRAILYPYDQNDVQWEAAILNAVKELKDTCNKLRETDVVEK